MSTTTGTTATVFAATDPGALTRSCAFGGTNPDHTSVCRDQVAFVIYPGQRFTCGRHLIDALPTISSGQTGDLKYASDTVKVWIERTGIADGEPFHRTATIEHYHDGHWTVWDQVNANDPRTNHVFVPLDVLDALRAVGFVPSWSGVELP